MADNGTPTSRERDTSPDDESSRRPSTVTSGVNLSQSQSTELPPRRRGQQSQPQQGGTYGTMSSSRQTLTSSPEIAPIRPGRKPQMGRRSTSHGPHKGQEFSVDDAEDEVDEDLAEQKQSDKQSKMGSSSTLRRQPSMVKRRATQQPLLPRVDSDARGEDDAIEQEASAVPTEPIEPSSDENAGLEDDSLEEEDDDDNSDAESFTLRDKQQAINQTHPFGIRIWKPALYKKDRSVQRTAEGDIHSTPGGYVSHWLLFFNLLWTLLFGWWLCLLAALPGIVCFVLGVFPGCIAYGKIFFDLAGYLFYPFGKYVKLLQDEAYAEEDEGEGRSISEYEQWQSGDIEAGRLFFGPLNRSLVGHRRNSVESLEETDSLLGRRGRGSPQREGTQRTKRRLFGRGKWSLGRVIFFVCFYGLITPALALVSAICWLLVFTIPMGKVTFLIFDHMRRHPLALSFHSDSAATRRPSGGPSSILVCTYRAVGPRYWKYTVDGTNIILINLLAMVLFAIFDFFILYEVLQIHVWVTNPGFMFILGIFSIIPLAYFIGQAVASISAQSSMGVGAAVNAFFATIVEVFLYCVALKEGKAQLVEGSIIGSIFAGILVVPGLSMCFGAFKRKTQRFNVKSAGVTSTMLLFAVIGAFGPTLFFQIYGSHELNCHSCVHPIGAPSERDCRRCYFSQSPSLRDRFYLDAVRPYTYFSAILLFLSYIIGLIFTLRTHAAVIWNAEPDEKRAHKLEVSTGQLSTSAMHSSHGYTPDGGHLGASTATDGSHHTDIRSTQMYKRIIGTSLKQSGFGNAQTKAQSTMNDSNKVSSPSAEPRTPHMVPPKTLSESDLANHVANATAGQPRLQNVPEEESELLRHVAEVAATAAAAAARESVKAPKKALHLSTPRPHATRSSTQAGGHDEADGGHGEAGHGAEGGGHDAPNWSRTKSIIILLVATVAYAVIAEILVRTVDSVLESFTVDEKFLGFTLFALVPNTTEFLNAISFAMNGNIALSMEIGSAYALQVCLLQAPALVAFSAVHNNYVDSKEMSNYLFTLIFPQWDMVTVILCVILLSYTVGEGKSNYFKGSMLLLAYLVVLVGFFFSSWDAAEVDPNDTLALSQTFITKGGGHSGPARPL